MPLMAIAGQDSQASQHPDSSKLWALARWFEEEDADKEQGSQKHLV